MIFSLKLKTLGKKYSFLNNIYTHINLGQCSFIENKKENKNGRK